MTNTVTIEKTEVNTQVQTSKMYKVLLHNDDKTTFDFVIAVLTDIFHRSVDDAIQVTSAIHISGIGIAGSPYTREIAEEKALETVRFARANNFPLTATYEEL
jgi:ATP-dependent Clp protease adaptor protein ClpS